MKREISERKQKLEKEEKDEKINKGNRIEKEQREEGEKQRQEGELFWKFFFSIPNFCTMLQTLNTLH